MSRREIQEIAAERLRTAAVLLRAEAASCGQNGGRGEKRACAEAAAGAAINVSALRRLLRP